MCLLKTRVRNLKSNSSFCCNNLYIFGNCVEKKVNLWYSFYIKEKGIKGIEENEKKNDTT